MFYGHHFQNAYVTRDLDRGIAQIGALGAIDHEVRFRAEMQVETPEGPKTLALAVALLWVGRLQYEIIQPLGGEIDIFSAALPEGEELRFHHICHRVLDWQAFQNRLAQQALPIVMQGETPKAKFLYLDARESLGHFIEYYWTTDAHWRANGGPDLSSLLNGDTP